MSWMSWHIQKVDSYRTEPFGRLQQLYEFEFAPFTGARLNSSGLYSPEEIEQSWSPHGYHLYVLWVDDLPAGLAVINLSSMINGDRETRDVAEFFVVPEYRRQKLGSEFAQELFRRYPGRWEVRELPGLEEARQFWKAAIKSVDSCFLEEIDPRGWRGYLQKFVSPGVSKKQAA